MDHVSLLESLAAVLAVVVIVNLALALICQWQEGEWPWETETETETETAPTLRLNNLYTLPLRWAKTQVMPLPPHQGWARGVWVSAKGADDARFDYWGDLEATCLYGEWGVVDNRCVADALMCDDERGEGDALVVIEIKGEMLEMCSNCGGNPCSFDCKYDYGDDDDYSGGDDDFPLEDFFTLRGRQARLAHAECAPNVKNYWWKEIVT